MRTTNIVLVLCGEGGGVKKQTGKRRSSVHAGPTVLSIAKTPLYIYCSTLQFLLDNGTRWTAKISNKIIHGSKREIIGRTCTREA
jgi:hypothetical protein